MAWPVMLRPIHSLSARHPFSLRPGEIHSLSVPPPQSLSLAGKKLKESCSLYECGVTMSVTTPVTVAASVTVTVTASVTTSVIAWA